jgi:predicted transcriptional regulator YheO
MMKHPLSRFIPVADAIAKLLHPFAEVVIHDLDKNTIIYIANPYSGRKAGDSSLLDLKPYELNSIKKVIGPYEKAGENGQRIRSITAVLKNHRNKSIGILCINLDFSPLESALDLLDGLVRPPHTEALPDILFRKDWRDSIKFEIRSFLIEKEHTIDSLNADGRMELMKRLDDKRLFYARKSVEQIASLLKISRSTAYKYLYNIRNRTRSGKVN